MPRPDRAARYPLGATLRAADLDRDPYPAFSRLREEEPISWIADFGMWYVTRYDDVREILLDDAHFTNACERSPIVMTFGSQMLNLDGAEHVRLRGAFAPTFRQANVRDHFEEPVRDAVRALIATFRDSGEAEIRTAFAARLPIWTMLHVFHLPRSAESSLRGWYDSFESSLANFDRDETIFVRAWRARDELHRFVDEALDAAPPGTLLHALATAPAETRLTQDEIRRNLSIVFFGGISTVEALTLNMLWALLTTPMALGRVLTDRALLAAAVEETMRWCSPVQSATRYVLRDVEWRGHEFFAGEIVNCMLGAANRDPAVFVEPEKFDLERENARRHVGFAAGAHLCLGSMLARAQARIAIDELLTGLPQLRLVAEKSAPPMGREFHQPAALTLAWRA